MAITQRIVGEEAVEKARGVLGDKARDLKDNFGQIDFVCEPADLVEVMTKVRDELGCTFFTFLAGIDRTELEEDKTVYGNGLEVLIHVYSPEHGTQVNVHVPLPATGAACPSITSVYRGAMWHERECFEFYGIEFDGHPQLVNLYLPEDFEGHPGLKSFKLPVRSAVKDWPGAKDPEEAAAGGR